MLFNFIPKRLFCLIVGHVLQLMFLWFCKVGVGVGLCHRKLKIMKYVRNPFWVAAPKVSMTYAYAVILSHLKSIFAILSYLCPACDLEVLVLSDTKLVLLTEFPLLEKSTGCIGKCDKYHQSRSWSWSRI